MKKQILFLIILISALLYNQKVAAQASSTIHAGVPGQYCGWDGTTTGQDFELRHNANRPITFFSDSVHRMIIDANGTGSASGYVGIGNNFLNPVSRLHLHQGGSQTTWFQMTGNNMSATALDGFRIGVLNPGTGTAFDVEIRQQENSPMKFYTNNLERMRMTTRTINAIARAGVGINEIGTAPVTFPRSILHLGQDYFTSGVAGWRTWMDIGTINVLQSDFAFFGMMPFDGDTVNGLANNDAVIAWGDNLNTVDGADNLRVIFSGLQGQAGQGNAASFNGLEVARFLPTGRMGVGNFTPVLAADGGGSGVPPRRRLEIYGENLDPFIHTANPQLRLTFRPDSTFTDFQTTNLGDLYIHPVDTINRERRVGINDPTPGNTLEINGTAGVSPELAGLRFTDLINTVTPITNPTRGVLSVDNDGDVIWVRDSIGTGGSNVSACSTPNSPAITLTNYLPKFATPGLPATICNSQVFDDGINVGIGLPIAACTWTTPCPFFKLTVNGSVAINDTAHLYKGSGVTFKRIFTVTGASTGNGNLSAGVNAGPAGLMTGIEFNTFVGNGCGVNAASSYNTFVGERAASAYVNDQVANPKNVFVGYNAATLLVTGRDNTIIGGTSAPAFTSGDYNTIIGNSSAPNGDDSLNYETYLGMNAGVNISTGNRNTMLGTESGTNLYPNTVRYHATALGAGARVDDDSCMVFGTAVDRIGIGTSSPRDSTKLTVNAFPFHSAAVYNGRVGIYQQTGAAIPLPVDSAVLTVRSYGTKYAAIFFASPDTTGWAAYFAGKTYSTGGYLPSDPSIKNKIQPMGNVQAMLDRINTYTYEYNTSLNSNMGLPGGPQAGFMANEIEATFPHLVASAYIPPVMDPSGKVTAPPMNIKTINYTGLIPYLFKGMKEQKEQIEALTAKQELIQQQLDLCCNASPRTTGSGEFPVKQTIDLGSSDPILYQNQPNPFDNTTVIRYFISENSKQPKIIFQDETGRTINETAITEMGQGSIQINAASLNSGIYTYSLQIDGKIIDSKKMLKSK